MLTPVILPVALFAAAALAFQNDFDEPLLAACHAGEVIRSVYSIHNNYKEDRRWWINCGNATSDASPSTCHWSGYANAWDEPVIFNCPPDYVIAGVSSYHDNRREDRRVKFKCCQDYLYRTYSCGFTPYLNDWDGKLDYKIPTNKVMTGWASVHSNKKEDRLHKFMLCSYSKIEPYD